MYLESYAFILYDWPKFSFMLSPEVDPDTQMRNLAMTVCLCWGFTAQSTQWGHVERGQFT